IGLEPVIISQFIEKPAAIVQLGIKQRATAVQEQNANHHPSKNAFHKCPPTRQTSKLAHAQHPDAIAATRRDRSAQVMHRLMHSGSASLALLFGRQNGRISASIANAIHAAMLRALRRDRDLASGTAGHFSSLVPPPSCWLMMGGNRANLWSRVGTLSALAMPTLGERASRTTILPALRSAGNPTALKW